jgi:hypothetical protein
MTVAGRAAFQQARGITVKTSLKYAASLLSATAIVSVIGFAPIAAAATTHTVAPSHPGAAIQRATEPPAYGYGSDGYGYGYGVDPFVLTNTGADPFVLLPPGDGLAF